jgi:hypothetical protein
MRTRVDERLRLEATRFELRFSCRHCAYFDEARAECSEGYPNGDHLSSELSRREEVIFCKSFELS